MHQIGLQALVRAGVKSSARGSHSRVWPKRMAGSEWIALKAVP